VEIVDLVVVKRDGRKEPFDREKLKRGLIKATWKRSVTTSDIEKLLEEIERKLMGRKGTEFRSSEIGRLVLNRLKKLDLASYLAFASVYYNFRDIDDYRKAIETAINNNEDLGIDKAPILN
jgi:transcriptional repressor NrdR